MTGLVSAVQAKELAQDCHGEFVKFLLNLARKWRIHIVADMVEKDGDSYYNAALLAGPDDLVGKYRKIHLSDIDRG